MAESITVREVMDAWRGFHDFTKNPELKLDYGIMVFCSTEDVEGVPSTTLMARCRGYEFLIDSFPLQGATP